VNVVGHQAISPKLDFDPAHLFGQMVEIDLLVAVLEEDRLAPIAPRAVTWWGESGTTMRARRAMA